MQSDDQTMAKKVSNNTQIQTLPPTGIQPVVIITDSDPAVDAAIRQILPSTYLIHCAFHISQNLNKNLRKLLDNDYQIFIHNFYSYRNCIIEDEYWAYCYTKYHFTGRMIASSRVKSINAYLKRLLNNSNILLYDLIFEIQRLLDQQNKEGNMNSTSRVNQDVDMHEKRISEVVIEQLSNDILKATLNQMIEFVESHNIREIWAINVGNSLDIKHYVLLLQNWVTQEPFIVADKFIQKNVIYNYDEFNDSNTNFCLFNQNNNGFCEEKLTILEQKLIYGKLHRMYKKALNKALQSNSKSEQLINLLQEFTEDGELDLDKLDDINH
ncbi:hypothetical protein RhiirB3_444793 [Rhizophagus irregularis]|nr:hypothetical protein RhiirB3_444793 [Rhizophagus irregularis]